MHCTFLTCDPVKDNLTICSKVDRAIVECKSICVDSLAAVNAAISSSLGSVNRLSGTTLAFTIMKDMLPFTHKMQ